MSNDPWTGARLGTDQDAPLGGSQLAEAVQELGMWETPGFASTAARDAALAGWVANGNATADGMTCTVTGIGLQRLVGLVWTNDILAVPTSLGALSLTGNYTVIGAPYGPATVLQLGKRMRLIGSVTNGVTVASATKGTEYTLGNLPAGTWPANPISASGAFGDGVSFIGSAPIIVRPDGTVNFVAPVNFTTSLLHSLSIGTVIDWIVGF